MNNNKSLMGPFLVLPLFFFCSFGNAQVQPSEKAKTGNDDKKSLVTIQDFAWIGGHWKCDALGGQCEETWTPPMGNSMLGMFRLVKNDAMSFCEILSIQPQGNSFVLKLKHFDSELKGWEEKNETVDFPLVRVSDTEAVFKGLRFNKISQKEMHVFVSTKQGDKVVELKFEFKRAVKQANSK